MIEQDLINIERDKDGITLLNVPSDDTVINIRLRRMQRTDPFIIQDINQKSPTADEELMSVFITQWGDKNFISIFELQDVDRDISELIKQAIQEYCIKVYDFVFINNITFLDKVPRKENTIRYQRGVKKSLILHDIPEGDNFISVELRSPTKADERNLRNRDLKAVGTNEELLAALITRWDDKDSITAEELLDDELRLDASIILSQAVNKFFRKKFKFVEKRK